MFLERILFCCTFLPLIAACGGSTTVTLELKNAATVPTSSAAVVKREGKGLGTLGSTDQTSTVTIDSLKIPIADVGLSYADELYGTSSSAYLYTCTKGTAAGCEVELVGTALSNLLTAGGNTGTLTSGKTYASVMISTCPDSSSQTSNSYTAKIKAKASVGGTTYYTKTGSQYMTATAADYSAVEITFNTCRNYTVFSQPFTYDGSTLTVSLYVDLRNIAQVYGPSSTLYSNARSSLKCSVPSSTTPTSLPYLCLDYPDVGGTIKSGIPTTERYKVTNLASPLSAPRLIGFYFDSSGNPIGGYNRNYVTGATTEANVLTTPSGFKKAKLEGTGLYFTDYSGGTLDATLGSGTTVTNKASTQGDFTLKAFPRPAVDASSTFTTIYSGSDVTSTVNFQVTRLD